MCSPENTLRYLWGAARHVIDNFCLAWPLGLIRPTEPVCVMAAAMGPFTINIWVKANATDMEGDLFQYFFSHSAYASRQNYAAVDAFHSNQVTFLWHAFWVIVQFERPAHLSLACQVMTFTLPVFMSTRGS